ncbi:MAG: DUF4340 domain-containing protein [Planctomycetes bacterium]|nr:DUF4340 domain-containing protein [Planctomycetota bacterium]
MRKGTLLFLLALVGVLAFLWVQKEQETRRGGPALAEYPLCPELAAERVRKLRIEHLERGFEMALERDAAGRWFLTDPLAYPAQNALVRTLLEALESARGEPAPEVVLSQVGLDPPKVVLTLQEVNPDGERTLRIELGVVDLDSKLIYARIPGHPRSAEGGGDVFRTTRMLANTLERNPDDYRERSATSLSPQDVLSFRRQGQVFLAEEGRFVDLAFDALLGPDGWKRVTLPTVSLDPQALGLLVRGGTDLAIEHFVDDSPQDLARWGLDKPVFTVALEPLDGPLVTLSFAHGAGDGAKPLDELPWFCMRQGFAHVWEVRLRDVELLTRPADLFFDSLVVRMLRSDVTQLELEGGGTRRVLVRETKRGKDHWTVREDGPAGAGVAQPGNAAAIEAALAQLERVQLAEYLQREPFEAADPPQSFTVVLSNGARLGGTLGRATRDPKSAAQGRQYLRAGDEVVALIGDDVGALCLKPLDEFRSRRVHDIQESTVRALELEHDGKTFTFVNNGDNQWSPRGEPIAAPKDFTESLDKLLHLAVKRWLAVPGESQVLLRVRILPLEGEALAFTFGRGADGTVQCVSAAGLAAEVEGELPARLLKLF